MGTLCLGRWRFSLILPVVTIIMLLSAASPAQAVSVQFAWPAGPCLAVPNAPAGRTIRHFPAQVHPGGKRWETTAGSVILDVVPGPAGISESATLTLTGPFIAGEVFDVLDIIYDGPPSTPGAPPLNDVTIAFSSSDTCPIVFAAPATPDFLMIVPGDLFPPFPPHVFESASLAGRAFRPDTPPPFRNLWRHVSHWKHGHLASTWYLSPQLAVGFPHLPQISFVDQASLWVKRVLVGPSQLLG